jgi:hypothetical protein
MTSSTTITSIGSSDNLGRLSASKRGFPFRPSAVQGSHDADPGEHCRAAELDHQHQRFHGCLPFG